MNVWVLLGLFCFLGVVYLNFLEEIKVGKELEILELDYVNNQHLQETCRMKQPLLFQLRNGVTLPDSHYLCTFELAAFSEKYGKERVVVYESKDQAMELPLEDAAALFTTHGDSGEEKEARQTVFSEGSVFFWSENNQDLIDETPLKRYFRSCDAFLAPFGTVDTDYDLLLGCAGTTLPVRYHRRHSYHMLVLQGEIKVQVAPFKYSAALGNQFTQWNEYTLPEPNVHARQVEKEVPWMEVQITSGNCFFLPPYWWHEIYFSTDAQVAIFMYDNLMNAIIIPLSTYFSSFGENNAKLFVRNMEWNFASHKGDEIFRLNDAKPRISRTL